MPLGKKSVRGLIFASAALVTAFLALGFVTNVISSALGHPSFSTMHASW